MAHPIPQAKTALKAILAARGAWAAVDIRDGKWTEGEDVTRDVVWFEGARIPRDAWASLGAQRRRVEFQIRFTIAVLREGDDERTTEDALWTLVEDLMAAIKADPTFTQTIQQADDVIGDQTNSPIGPSLWESKFAGYIVCLSKAY